MQTGNIPKLDFHNEVIIPLHDLEPKINPKLQNKERESKKGRKGRKLRRSHLTVGLEFKEKML